MLADGTSPPIRVGDIGLSPRGSYYNVTSLRWDCTVLCYVAYETLPCMFTRGYLLPILAVALPRSASAHDSARLGCPGNPTDCVRPEQTRSDRPACFQGYRQLSGNRSPLKRLAKAFASSGLAKQNTTKSLSLRRREYVNGVADRTPAAENITSLFTGSRTLSAGSAT
jgi:hypothetical protein